MGKAAFDNPEKLELNVYSTEVAAKQTGLWYMWSSDSYQYPEEWHKR